MKKKITREEMMDLLHNINGKALLEYRNVKFSHALDKNRVMLTAEAKSIYKAIGFEKEHLAELSEEAKKLRYPELRVYIEKNIKDLDVRLQMITKVDQNEEFLQEEVELDLYGILLDNLPDDLKEGDYRMIRLLILEDESAKKAES